MFLIGLSLSEVHRDALAATDAHGHHGVALVGALELVGALDGEDGTSGSDGMADGDAAAVDVSLSSSIAEIARHGEGLGGKRLV